MEVIVFTNGCFDIIHPGHIDLLKRARRLGTRLIVGINSDDSVRGIKGEHRPFVGENDRAKILRNFDFVDEVRIFNEQTPEQLIKDIQPHILVKGGDWSHDEIVGADFVESKGGKVVSLPLLSGYSSSNIVNKIRQSQKTVSAELISENLEVRLVNNSLLGHIECFQRLLFSETKNIEKCAEIIYGTFLSGNKILICGNGGSAADAQHLAAEFVGRYETERKALPAIALTTDTSALTALSNDYGFDHVFARQIDALGVGGDLLIAISTSGNSPNIIKAVMAARRKGCQTIALTGAGGKKLASLCDYAILVPESRTARIQEAHITIAHIWCEFIDRKNVS